MIFISKKRKNRIGKLIAATKHIAVQSIGESDRKIQIESMSKIIENLAKIAWEVGGDKFTTIEVPAYEHALKSALERREDGNRKDSGKD